jgi:hypothetical protein
VAAADVTIRATVAPLHATYWFRCPLCSKPVERNAGPGVIMLLLRAGARVARAQPVNGDAAIDPSPFTEADVTAFLEELDALPSTDG